MVDEGRASVGGYGRGLSTVASTASRMTPSVRIEAPQRRHHRRFGRARAWPAASPAWSASSTYAPAAARTAACASRWARRRDAERRTVLDHDPAVGIAPKQAVRHHKGNLWHFSEKRATCSSPRGPSPRAGPHVGARHWRVAFRFLARGVLLTPLLAMLMMLIAVGPAFLLHEIGQIVAGGTGAGRIPRGPQGLALRRPAGRAARLPLHGARCGDGRWRGHPPSKRPHRGGRPAREPRPVHRRIALGALLLGLTNAFEIVPSMDEYFVDGALNWPLMLINICTFWLYANLILLFNMLPFGPSTGSRCAIGARAPSMPCC